MASSTELRPGPEEKEVGGCAGKYKTRQYSPRLSEDKESSIRPGVRQRLNLPHDRLPTTSLAVGWQAANLDKRNIFLEILVFPFFEVSPTSVVTCNLQ